MGSPNQLEPNEDAVRGKGVHPVWKRPPPYTFLFQLLLEKLSELFRIQLGKHAGTESVRHSLGTLPEKGVKRKLENLNMKRVQLPCF